MWRTQNQKMCIHLEGKQKDLLVSGGPAPPSPPHPLDLFLPWTVGPSPDLGLLRFRFLLSTLGEPTPSTGGQYCVGE